MATLSKFTFNPATIGVPFSDTITVIMTVQCPPPIGPLEVLQSVTMTAVNPLIPTGILPGLDPGLPAGNLIYIPTATPSASYTISINGTFNETYFDEREWEYRDDTTGKSYHTPILELESSMQDPAGLIYTVSKNNVQPDAYTDGGSYEDDIPNPIDTLIRYKPDFRASRTVTYTYTVVTICAGVPLTYIFNVTQNVLNNWDLGRDKMKNILANNLRYT